MIKFSCIVFSLFPALELKIMNFCSSGNAACSSHFNLKRSSELPFIISAFGYWGKTGSLTKICFHYMWLNGSVFARQTRKTKTAQYLILPSTLPVFHDKRCFKNQTFFATKVSFFVLKDKLISLKCKIPELRFFYLQFALTSSFKSKFNKFYWRCLHTENNIIYLKQRAF